MRNPTSLTQTVWHLRRPGLSVSQGGWPLGKRWPTRRMAHAGRSLAWLTTVVLFTNVMAQAPASAPASVPAPASPSVPAFRHVYLPIEELEVVFGATPGVLLNKAEFLDLWRKAYPQGRPTLPDPNEILLTRADYHATVEGSRLRLRGELEILKRGNGWASFPLTLEGASILSATLDGAPAMVGIDDHHQLKLLAQAQGTKKLQLDLTTPLVQGREARVARFRLPSAAGELAFAVPQGTELRTGGRTVATSDAKPVRIPVPESGAVELMLIPTAAVGRKPSLIVAHSQTTVRLSLTQTSWSERTQVAVHAQAVDALEIEVPLGVQLVAVESTGLVRWTTEERPGGTRLALRYASPWMGTCDVTLSGIGAATLGTPWRVPHSRLVDAAVHTGELVVAQDAALMTELVSLRGAARLPPARPEVKDVRFTGWQGDYQVELLMRPRQPRLASSVVTILEASKSRIDLRSSLKIESRNAPLFDVSVALPETWLITAIESQGVRQSFDLERVEGAQRATVYLPQAVPANRAVDLSVMAERPLALTEGETAPATAELATVRVVGAHEVEGLVLLRAPAELELQYGELKGYQSTAIAGVAQADGDVRAALQYRNDSASGRLTIVPRLPQISVATQMVVGLLETRMLADYRVRYDVRGGATDRLTFELPADIDSAVQVMVVEGTARLASQTMDVLADRRRRVRLRFDQLLRAPHTLAFLLEKPRVEGGPTEIPVVTVDGALRQSGTIAVESAFEQEVALTATGLREIDPSELGDLPTRTPRGRIAAAYRYHALPYRLGVSAVKHPPVEVLTALCRHAEMTSVIGAAGVVRHHGRFTLENVGLQALTFVLPQDAELLAVVLDNQPVEVRRQGERYLVPLPPRRLGTQAAAVELHYLTPGDRLGLASTLRQQPPELNVPVLKIDWKVYIPENHVIVWSDGSASPVRPLERNSLIGSLRAQLMPRGGRRVFNPFEFLLPMAGKTAAMDAAASPPGSRLADLATPAPRTAAVGLDGRGGMMGGAGMREAGRVPAGGLGGARGPATPDQRVHAIAKSQAAPPAAPRGDTQLDARKEMPREPKTDEKPAELATRPAKPAAEAPQPPQDKSSLATAPKGGAARREARRPAGALLSLPFALEPVGRLYEFQGLSGNADLALGLQQDRYTTSMMAAATLVLILGGWTLRRTSLRLRVSVVATLLVLAVGLSALAPLAWLHWLDAVFLGSVGTSLLWIVRAVLRPLGVRGVAAGLTFALLFGISSAAQAHGPKAPQVGGISLNQENPTEPTTQAPHNGATGSTTTPPKPRPQRDQLPTIFLPYDSRKNPLEASQVYLPQSDFQHLWNLANPDQVLVTDPALRAAVVGVEIRGRMAAGRARFTATMTIWSFRDAWTAVRLPIANAVIERVTLDGAPATLAPSAIDPRKGGTSLEKPASEVPGGERAIGPEGKAAPAASAGQAAPFPMVLVQGRGRHRLEVEFSRPIEQFGATGSLALELARTGSAQLVLTLPSEGLDVEAEGLLGGWEVRRNELSAAVHHGGTIRIRWRPPGERRDAAAVVTVMQQSRLAIGPASIALAARFDYAIRQGTVDRFVIALPATLRVKAVAGPEVVDWLLQGEGNERRLVVRCGRPVSGQVVWTLECLGEALSESGPTAVGELVPLEVARETSERLIVVDPRLEVQVRVAEGMQQMPRTPFAGVPVDAASKDWAALAAYRSTARPARLHLSVAPKTSKRISQVQLAARVEPERVRYQMRLEVTDHGVAGVAVRIRLPRGFVLDQVSVPDGVAWEVLEGPDGGMLELVRSTTDAALLIAKPVVVQLEGWLPREPANPAVAIVAPEVEGATRQTGEWAIAFAAGFDAETRSLTGVRPMEPQHVAPWLASMAPRRGGAIRSHLAFLQEQPGAKVELALRRLEPRVRGEVVSVVSVRDVAVAYLARIEWTIEQAGIRAVSWIAPAWLGADLDVVGPGIRQVQSERVDGQRRRFRVQLEREVVGTYAVVVRKMTPVPENRVVMAPRFELEGVEGQADYVALENLSPDQLDRVEEAAMGIETLEPDGFPRGLAAPLRRRAVAVLRLGKEARGVAWRLQTSAAVEALAASVNLAELTFVVDAAGHYRAQANFRVHNRQEQFLPLAMPAETTIWSVTVAGAPSRPAKGHRDGRHVVLIPLAKTAAGEFASLVEVVYSGRLPTEGGTIRRWRFPSPDVLGLPVAATQWTLYLPDEFDYGMFRGNLEEAEPILLQLHRDSAQYREAFQLLSAANYGRGEVRQRARQSLLAFEPGRSGGTPQTSKGQELQQRLDAEARQLAAALEALKQQPEAAYDAGRVIDADYFEPLPAVQDTEPEIEPLRQVDQEREATESDPHTQQAVRGKLRQQVQTQVKELQRSASAAPRPTEDAASNRGDLARFRQDAPASAGVTGNREAGGGGGAAGRASGGDNANLPSTPGGLSLKIELPKVGKPIHFVKARGEPELSVAFYDARTTQWGVGLVWLVATALVVVLLAAWVLAPRNLQRLSAHGWSFAFVASVVVWLLVPAASAVGFVVLAAIACGAAARYLVRKVAAAVRPA